MADLTSSLLAASEENDGTFAKVRGGAHKALQVLAVVIVSTGAACGLVTVAGLNSTPDAFEPPQTGFMSKGGWTPAQPAAWENQAFELLMEFHIPYMQFAEDVYIHSDPVNGHMRLSYYNGANVFLINTTGHSFELVPVAEYESCLVTESVRKLELVIPDLALFREKGKWEAVTLTDENGLQSQGYKFTLDLEQKGDEKGSKDWSYYTPTDNFIGVYTFFVNATAGGTPVNMTFSGHNAFLVQSHDDDYVIQYKAFHPRPEGIDRSFFLPPQGMPCTAYDNPTGPFQGKIHPMNDFAMAMPGFSGDTRRQSVLRDMFTHFSKSCTGLEECSSRQQTALRHYRWVQAFNRRGGKYKVGVNHMFDWSPEERMRVLGRRQVQLSGNPDQCGMYTRNWTALPPLPEKLDLRESGLVAPPRDQGTCGSCWAFGTIGMLEGQIAKKFGKIIRLSEQHLLDCSWSLGNNACDGGLDWEGLSWLLLTNGGELPTADSYGRYLSQNGFCHFDKSKNLHGLQGIAAPPPGAKMDIDVAATIKSCWHVPGPAFGGVEAAILKMSWALVSEGPVSVSLDASRHDLYYYAGGVYDNPLCKNDSESLDHTVLLVGYGKDLGEGYWLLRNSWSSNWGEAGFIRIAQRDNVCGITQQGAFALLK